MAVLVGMVRESGGSRGWRSVDAGVGRYDTDRSGSLDKEELRSMLQDISQLKKVARPAARSPAGTVCSLVSVSLRLCFCLPCTFWRSVVMPCSFSGSVCPAKEDQ
eukprot:1196588-Rhodomonas_salina.4